MRRQRWRCRKCRIVFFPLDHKLGLGTGGYSPRLLEKAVRQAAKAPSYKQASEGLKVLAEVRWLRWAWSGQVKPLLQSLRRWSPRSSRAIVG